MIRGPRFRHLNLSHAVLLQEEMNQQLLMAVFSSAKMSHQRVRMKLCAISQVVLSLICAHALTLIAPISYLPKRSFMKRLCCQFVRLQKNVPRLSFCSTKIKQKICLRSLRRLRRDRRRWNFTFITQKTKTVSLIDDRLLFQTRIF